jgi:hypothetical protein
MAKDIIIIPTYMRPEYLNLCLSFLAGAEFTDTPKEFWICQDMRPDDQFRHKIMLEWTAEVLSTWRGRLPLKLIKANPHTYAGNSFNLMEAYKRAYQAEGVRYVYLVEDDVLVMPDFFRWHEAIQEKEPDAMCSIAYRCSRNHEARTDVTDPGAYFTTARDYASIGVCWKWKNLEPLLEHARPEYYANQEEYIRKTFPGNRFSGDFCEQDGLIMRCLWNVRGFTVWPYTPRAYHVGFVGYHRPNGFRPNGFLEAKASWLRSAVHNAEEIKRADKDFGDIEPVPTEPVALWNDLRKLQHFD